ncbi:Fujikurins efflux protein [Fusarium oxysporum f. sp. albedinis]|nr:Fujikurins efflux protein [Fusarium oxysporum f. sp. albedinis]
MAEPRPTDTRRKKFSSRCAEEQGAVTSMWQLQKSATSAKPSYLFAETHQLPVSYSLTRFSFSVLKAFE